MSILKTLKLITEHPLNRGQKIRSLVRFTKWQIGSRLLPGAVVYDWVNGAKFLVKNGETGLTGNIYTGLHEFSDMGFLLHVLRDGDLFIDVGANAGSYTILACSAVGARGIAFEPIPNSYKRLMANIRLNDLDEKVILANMGVGAQHEHIVFTSDSDTINHVLARNEQNTNTTDVEMTTLDTFLQGESPALVKIDVEGYETPVLEGAGKKLKNQGLHSVIMELNGSGSRYGYDESKILELMFDYGFKTYCYNPLNRILTKLKGKNLNSGNTLFIRNKSLVEERLRKAQKVSINGYQF